MRDTGAMEAVNWSVTEGRWPTLAVTILTEPAPAFLSLESWGSPFRIPAKVIARVAVAAFASGPTRRTA